tara:strand:+ start:4330 stop:4800 length:471 start_codon:yes stop_codon:yes gene_type:complete
MKRCHAILAVDVILLLVIVTLTSCSMKQWYPTMGAVVGGGAGALGGPGIAAVGAGGGALVGEVLQGNKEVAEAKETIDALTSGDVSALVEKGMAQHASGFEEFTSYIKRILIIAACILAVYLSIPIFVARKTAETCSKTAAEKHLTRPPFPTNEKS